MLNTCYPLDAGRPNLAYLTSPSQAARIIFGMLTLSSANLIVGAGAIGCGLAQKLLDRGDRIHLTTRDIAAWGQQQPELLQHANIYLHSLALDDEARIATLAHKLRRQQVQLRRLIVCSGLLHNDGHSPEKNLEEVDQTWLSQNFAINAIAPLLLLKHCLPLFPAARPGLFAALSARVGSIGDNRLGGWYSYRAAKAALNQSLRTAAIELRRRRPGLICVSLHPGTVDSPLSKPFQRGVPPAKLFSPNAAAGRLLSVMDQLTPADSGKFLAWDGSQIPW